MTTASCVASLGSARAESRGSYAHGLNVLGRVAGGDALRALRGIEKLAPDLVRQTVEFAYGKVVGRQGLPLAERELYTVAMLMAHGSARPQLQFHMAGFLNVGGAPDDLVEIVVLAAPLIGFTAAIDAIGGVRTLFADRGLAARAPVMANEDRMRRGEQTAAALHGELSSEHPDLARWQLAVQFGEVMGRGRLSPRVLSLAAIAMLAAGARAAAVKSQMRSAVRLGVAPAEIVEVLMQLAVYAGFPTALNGLGALSAVLAEGPAAAQPPVALPEPESRAERMERGNAFLARTTAGSGEAVVRSFDDLAPDLGRLIVEHAYGDVFSRAGLDPKVRELCAISALAGVGSTTTEVPLKVHMRAAIKLGATRAEIEEVLLNLEPYLGQATAAKALAAVAEEMGSRQ